MTDNSGFTERLAEEMEPSLLEAFLEAIDEFTTAVEHAELLDAIKRGDIPAILDMLDLPVRFFWPLKEAHRAAFNAAGVQTLSSLVDGSPRARGFLLRAKWDGDNPRAAFWAATKSSTLISDIAEDQKLGVRDFLLRAFEERTPPAKIAQQLVGKVNKTTGRREGGIIGLTNRQIHFVDKVRGALGATPPDWLYYKTLESRNKNLDGMVKRAWKAKTSLTDDQIDKAVIALENKLLKRRGESIARTETHAAVHQAQWEAMEQQIENGVIDEDAITKVWSATMDDRTRDSHRELNGVKKKFRENFVSPETDAEMKHPGDTSLDAKGSDVIQCFPPWSKLTRVGLTAAVRRDYCNDLVEMSLCSGEVFTVTPNHPVLTIHGWVPAGLIKENDQLFKCRIADPSGPRSSCDVEQMEATAEKIYGAAESLRGSARVMREVVNFHGDIPDQDVDIVSIPSSLGTTVNTSLSEELHDRIFAFSDVDKGSLLASRLEVLSRAPDLLARGSFGVRHINDAEIIEAAGHDSTSDAQFFGDAERREAFTVESLDLREQRLSSLPTDDGESVSSVAWVVASTSVKSVRRFHYAGPVYSFESLSNVLIAEGIVNHNCRCHMYLRVDWMRGLT